MLTDAILVSEELRRRFNDDPAATLEHIGAFGYGSDYYDFTFSDIIFSSATGTMVLHLLEPTGPRVEDQVARLLQAGAYTDDVPLVATGYGRRLVHQSTRRITEITCHARGVRELVPEVGTVIDIGGQDSKAIALEVDLDGFGPLSLKADRPAAISSLCTVFAESEVISLIAGGETRENIIAGIHAAIASRIAAMAGHVGIVAPVMMTGGVARNSGVVRALEAELKLPVAVSPQAQVVGAIGAAAIAAGL